MFVREELGSGGQPWGYELIPGTQNPSQHCNSPKSGWEVVSGWVVGGEAVVIVSGALQRGVSQ